jgi:hypothetical protein
MDAYMRLGQDMSSTPEWWASEQISSQELYGIYQGKKRDPNNSVVVANEGLYIRSDNEWKLIVYANIKVEPPTKKAALSGLNIQTNNEEIITLPIDNNDSDVFEFWRFLMRAREVCQDRGQT